jgi:CBS domain-containing protein
MANASMASSQNAMSFAQCPANSISSVGMHVRDIMTVEVHTCTPDTTVAELMKMMTEHRIRHVPVVNKNKNLISIVSIGDVVKNRVGEMESENEALRSYVTS